MLPILQVPPEANICSRLVSLAHFPFGPRGSTVSISPDVKTASTWLGGLS